MVGVGPPSSRLRRGEGVGVFRIWCDLGEEKMRLRRNRTRIRMTIAIRIIILGFLGRGKETLGGEY